MGWWLLQPGSVALAELVFSEVCEHCRRAGAASLTTTVMTTDDIRTEIWGLIGASNRRESTGSPYIGTLVAADTIAALPGLRRSADEQGVVVTDGRREKKL